MNHYDHLQNEIDQPLRTAVGAIMWRSNGTICAISRKNDKADLGFPGGKPEPGETEVQALIRELREELGIEVTACQRLFAALDEGGYWFVLYVVYDWKGEAHDAEKKGAVVEWVEPLRIIQDSCSFRKYNIAALQYLGVLPPSHTWT